MVHLVMLQASASLGRQLPLLPCYRSCSRHPGKSSHWALTPEKWDRAQSRDCDDTEWQLVIKFLIPLNEQSSMKMISL